MSSPVFDPPNLSDLEAAARAAGEAMPTTDGSPEPATEPQAQAAPPVAPPVSRPIVSPPPEVATAPQPAPEATHTQAAPPATSAESAELTELRTRLAALEAKDTTNRRLARDGAAIRLGVMPHYLGFVPDVDAATDDGRLALERWVADHPEVAPGYRPPQPAPDYTKLGNRVCLGPDNQELAQLLAATSKPWILGGN